MANEKNLTPFTSEQSREEAVKNGRKGGQASGVAKRRKKSMKAAAKMLLDMPVTSKELQQKMKLLGVPDGDSTYQMAVMVAMLNQAMKGNVKATYFLRDTAGESPSDQIRREELKVSRSRASLEREKFEYEKAGAEHEKASLADAIQAAYEERRRRNELTPPVEADGDQAGGEGANSGDD